jgi:prepilin-type N-terminal cleavage/methylation domain-containing protein
MRKTMWKKEKLNIVRTAIKIDSFILGFTLMECMITIAIIAILSAIVIPSYQFYQAKARFVEIVQAVMPYKLAVAECVMEYGGEFKNCDAGESGIPKRTEAVGHVALITVEKGAIVATPVAGNGLKSSDTYVLSPVWHEESITWVLSGGAVKRGLVHAS